ncbi:MAG: mechanosensitive ion channel family protein [Microthrixaceae bacterium]
MPQPPRSLRRHLSAIGLAVLVLTTASLVGRDAADAQTPSTDPAPTVAPPSTDPPPDSTTTAPTTAPTTVAPSGSTPSTSTVTTSTPSSTAPTTTVAGSGGGPPASEPSDTPAPGIDASTDPDSPTPTTLPTGPPDGFTEEQFRTFVGVVTACGPDPGVVCSRVLSWTDNRTVAEAAQWISEVPVRILLVVGLALLANWAVRRAIARYVARLDRRAAVRTDDDRVASERRTLRMATASTTLASAATVAIFVAAVFVALAQIDISLGPLLAGAGILGVALGFGAQNVVRDLLAGLFVLVEDQYGIGDVIDVGRASGTVEGISLRVTKLRDVEGTLWFVPNGLVNEVGNLTQRWARVILDTRIAYGADHHLAERLIKDVANSLWLTPDSEYTILEEPELWGVELLGDSSVSIRLAVKCAPADQWAVGRALRSRIKDRLDLAGFEFPFPQQAVWVRAEPDASPLRTG